MMNTVNYCWTCQKTLTGKRPEEEHYASASHKKKSELEFSMMKNSVAGNFHCKICNISCSSDKSYQEHRISQRHREIERRVSIAIFSQEKNNQLLAQSGGSYYFDTAKGRGYCKICEIELTSQSHAHQHLNGDKHKKKESKNIEKSTEHGNLSCKLCGIYVTGPENMSQHLQSEKHKKKEALDLEDSMCMEPSFEFQGNIATIQSNPTRDKIPSTSSNIVPVDEIKSLLSNKDSRANYNPTCETDNFDEETNYCRVCDISLKGQINLRQHIDSKEHSAKKLRPKINMTKISDNLYQASLKLPQVHHVTPVERDEYTFNGSTGFCHICNIQLTSASHAEQHLSGAKHCKASNLRGCKIESADQNTEDESYIFNNGRGRCFVCDIELTSQMHAKQHLSGQKHQKAKARSAESFKEYPLTCDVCTVSFTGQESAKQHFTSQKHVKKMKMKMANNGTTFGSVLDKTNWLYCDVCECPLNSAEQLKIHRQSPKHFSQLQKKRNFPFHNSDRSSSSSRDGDIDLGFQFDSQSLQQKKEEINRECEQKIIQLRQEAEQKKKQLLENNMINSSENYHCKQNVSIITGNNCTSKSFDFPEASAAQETSQFIVQRSIPDVSHGISRKMIKAGTDPQYTLAIHGNYEDIDQFIEDEADVQSSTFEDNNLRAMDESGFEMKKSKIRNFQPLKNRSMNRTKESIDLNDDLNVHAMSAEENFEETREESLCEYVSFVSSSDSCSISSSGNSNMMPSDISDLRRYVQLPKGIPGKSNTINMFHKFYCNLCQKAMNTEKSLREHREGQFHKQKVLTMKAPPFQYPPVIKNGSLEEIKEKAPNLTERSKPRCYQIDLFQKSVQSDTVCFLPTGTGKTLIGVMALSFMLELNPQRPVLFLVDKTLLVMQQAKYIYKELAEKMYNRPKVVEDVVFEMEKRKLHIAVLCGGLQKTDTIPLWRHDIIITTAAFCENLLYQEIINWNDFSLIVFDEVHHCVKKHPYCTLMSQFHKGEENNKPKILGLTASPAGMKTEAETEKMLNELLRNLGGARMSIVESTTDLEELDKYKSNAELQIHCEPRTSKEEKFVQLLRSHIVNCYDKLCELTDLKEKKIGGFVDLMNKSVEERAKQWDDDDIEIFTYVLDSLRPSQKSNTTNCDLLRVYTKRILQALSDMETGSVAFAISNLVDCENDEKGNFKFAEGFGLRCDQLRGAIGEWRNLPEDEESSMYISSLKKLLETLTKSQSIDWTKEKSMALVLVQKRSVARRLSSFLRSNQEIIGLKLRVTHLVGHGGTGTDDGMKVKKQKQIMDRIKENYFHIVVATSIAEEGVDIPECHLVICLNPPSNVTALVQMRGRARKKESLFVVICSTTEQEEKINDLLKRESNMESAARTIVHNERRSRELRCQKSELF